MSRRVIYISALAVLLYAAFHAWWVYRYPPMLNDDHFHTETALTQLADPQLYPNDLAWSNRRHVESLGFLFLGALQVGQRLFGSYYDSWPYFTFLFLLVYLPGMYSFLYLWLKPSQPWQFDFTRHSIALGLAVLTTLPIYMTVTFANWGITSLYAHVFVTILTGWLFAAVVLGLERDYQAGYWAGLGLALAMSIFLNPVKGGGLVGMISVILVVEVLARRLHWTKLAALLGGAALPTGAFLVNYARNISPIASTPQEFEAAQAFLLTVHQGRIYPWGLSKGMAFGLLLASAVTALISLLLYTRRDPPQAWIIVFALAQLAWGYALMRHPIFLLAAGYWCLQRPPLDRWDRLILTWMAAINLGGPIASAVSQYLWEQHNLSAAYTVLYENIRLTRFIMLPIYALLARWAYQLLSQRDAVNRWAVLFMAASLMTIFGSANVVKDDAVLMKTLLPLRWAMPALALGLIVYGRWGRPLKPYQHRVLTILGTGIGGLFFGSMSPLDSISTMGVMILLIGAGLLLWMAWQANRPQMKTTLLPLGFLALTVLTPLAGYHKSKANQNFCDPPFLEHCVPRHDVTDAAEWLQTQTDNGTIIFVAGLQPERLQPLARRSTVHVNIYQIFLFQGPGALMEALPRYEALQGTNPLRADYKGDSYLFDALEKWEAEAIMIVGGRYRFDLPILYQNNSVVIYAFDPQ